MKDILAKYEINNLECNAQHVKSGAAFFAIKGNKFDGNDFINIALNNGAKVVITDQDINIHDDRIIYVNNVRCALAEAASIYYPSLPKYIVGVTGTNGKTSTCWYFYQICKYLGISSGYIGTLGSIATIDGADVLISKQGLTTPNPVSLHRTLDYMANNNVNYVALEASSHGLDQYRMHKIPFVSGAFISFSHDHLDYHLNLDRYLSSKLELFNQNLMIDGVAIINSDMYYAEFINEKISKVHMEKLITVGKNGDLAIKEVYSTLYEQSVEFTYKKQCYKFTTKILGNFQIYNILIASLLVESCGYNFQDIVTILSKLEAPRGRMETISSEKDDRCVIVDYAHSPEALELVLNTLSKIKRSRVIVLFGCGGERDQHKRWRMGNIAGVIADIVIITNDNPRSENADLIRGEILAGVGARDNVYEIADREEAIKQAISFMKSGDILLIAGKGHEDYQILSDRTIEFDDSMIAKKYLKLV